MADDILIGVGVRADFSSLKNEAKASADALKQAEAAWKDAFEQLGQAAEKGSTQAQEALKQYENELNQAQARAAAAGRAMAEAQAGAGAAAAHAVPQFAAASGALRELQGNFDHNIRAAERFLSTTLGLGPVLQAAFPVVGALAMGGVLFDIGEKLVQFGSDAAALGRELGGGWLDGAAAQVAGLAKEIKQADEELMKLAQDRDRTREKKDSEDVEHVRLQTQVDTYKKLTQGLGPENSSNQQAYAKAAAESQAAGQQAGDNLRIDQLQRQIGALEQIKQLHAQTVEQLEKEITSQDEVSKVGSVGIEKLRKDQEVASAQYKSALEDQIRLIEEKNNLVLKSEIAGQRGDRAEGRGSNKADEERLRADELALNKLRIDHKLTLDEEKSFWEQRIANYSAASSQYAQITAKLAQIADQRRKEADRGLKEGSKESTDELIAAMKKEQEENDKISDELIKTWEQQLKAQEEAAQAATRSAEAQIEAAAKVAEARIQYQLASGAITQQAATYELAQIKAKAYGDQIKALEEEMRRLQQIEGMGGNTQGRQNEVQDKIFGLQGDQQSAILQGATKDASLFQKPWLAAFRTLDTQWVSTMDRILRGQTSIAKGAAQMLDSMIIDTVNALARMALKWAAHYVLLNVLHIGSRTSQTAVDATANATQFAAAAVSNVMTASSYAAVAAAGALAATAAIPVIGPALAPGVAAAMLATGLGFAALASAAGGWGDIPQDTIAAVHKKEMILPAPLAGGVRDLIANGGGKPSQSNNTVINARVNQHFPSAKASSARETRATIQNLGRRGKLAFS